MILRGEACGAALEEELLPASSMGASSCSFRSMMEISRFMSSLPI